MNNHKDKENWGRSNTLVTIKQLIRWNLYRLGSNALQEKINQKLKSYFCGLDFHTGKLNSSLVQSPNKSPARQYFCCTLQSMVFQVSLVNQWQNTLKINSSFASDFIIQFCKNLTKSNQLRMMASRALLTQRIPTLVVYNEKCKELQIELIWVIKLHTSYITLFS